MATEHYYPNGVMANNKMDQVPCLISCKPLQSDFNNVQKICITSDEFTLGRGINNAAVIAFPSISRNHCLFRILKSGEWIIEDNSTFGIKINGNKLGKGLHSKISHDDIITLEPCQEFVYKFIMQPENEFTIPNKRRKISTTTSDHNIVKDMKIKFEESQNDELKHIENKIHNTQQILNTSKVLKNQLQMDMDRKIRQLEMCYGKQIENLKGEKDEVEKQKLLLIDERDVQLTSVKNEMQGKITELMISIKKHNETESALKAENNTLKENLLKEREEFLNELSKESSSKQEMLEKLEAKIRDQEETNLKERERFEEMLKKEIEQLRLAKEKELNELEKEKKQFELELKQELNNVKKNLEDQVKQTDEQRLKAEQQLNEQMEIMKKHNDEEKIKMDQLIQEREQIQMELSEAAVTAAKSYEELKAHVTERETELAALAAERIQIQADQSSKVIQNLQEQLEKVKSQLQNVKNEKNNLIQNMNMTRDDTGESSSKQAVLNGFGELLENELQCSICAELFVKATTLNCSHTFCKYCINKWKWKKKECPNCRAQITTECPSLVLDSFIDKMVENLTEDMKIKRQAMLASREKVVPDPVRHDMDIPRRYFSDESSNTSLEEETEDEDTWSLEYRGGSIVIASESDRDDSSDDLDPGPRRFLLSMGISEDGTTRRRREFVPGVPGSYYGGYGRCFHCGVRGHWAPGCPSTNNQ